LVLDKKQIGMKFKESIVIMSEIMNRD
jgi:hypothetical protein